MEKIYKWLELSGAKFGDTSKIELAINLIHEELEEGLLAVKNNDKKELLDFQQDLNWVVLNLMYFSGIKIEEMEYMAKKVEESNYSKFCNSESEAVRTKNAYTEGTHWDKMGVVIPCYYDKYQNYWIVKRLSDNKILKSIEYKKV